MAVYLTTLRGTIHEGSLGEIFSHSLGIVSNAEPSVVAQAVHDSWQTAFLTPPLDFASAFNPGVVYVEATAALVLDPMVPDLGAAAHSLFNPPMAGTSTFTSLPSQNAVAVSLRAGQRPNGSPFRGRFYLPPVDESQIGPDGLLLSSTTGRLADATVVFLQALIAGGHTPSVWSRTIEDLVQPVDSIRVGNRVDTIRSRRNRFPEVYVERTI